MHQAFYRKYRPKVFSDVVGRDAITAVLRGQVKTGKTSHAYLFCGMRGSGKTTCAKILAKAVNCLTPENGDPCGHCDACRAIDSGLTLDIVEMDAASNNGVGDVRDMIEQLTYTPSELRMKVYIIDEVHMLSTAAFNALLKTLEEPPLHVMFILATTELHKLPATIISRCQRYDFDRIPMDAIVSRLRFVADQEKIDISDDALYVMAKLSAGALRDALGYLELCSAAVGPLDEKKVSSLLGTGSYDELTAIVDAISSNDLSKTLMLTESAYKHTNDISVLFYDIVSVYRDILVYKATGSASYTDATPAQAAKISAMSGRFNREKLMFTIKTLEDAIYMMQRSASQKRIIADMCMIRLCDERLSDNYEALASRVAAVEDSVTLLKAGGIPIQAARSAQNVENESAPSLPAQSGETDTPAVKNSEKQTMKLSRKFADIASKMKTTDPTSAMYISTAKGYECDDGTYRIFFSSDFFLSLAEQNKDKIDTAVMTVTGKYTPGSIILYAGDKASEFLLIDDVIDALSEQSDTDIH